MLNVKYKNYFEKNIKLAKKRGKNMDKLKEIITLLADDKPLPQKYRDHALIGNFVGHRECHIKSNWLLIYKKEQDKLILERIGTYSDLF